MDRKHRAQLLNGKSQFLDINQSLQILMVVLDI